MHFWGATAIFPIFCNGQHQFCVSVDTQKTRDPNFRGVGIWKFCSRMHFWGATAIFPIFCNGRHQFCVSFDTQKARDPNFRGISNWQFCSRMHLRGLFACVGSGDPVRVLRLFHNNYTGYCCIHLLCITTYNLSLPRLSANYYGLPTTVQLRAAHKNRCSRVGVSRSTAHRYCTVPA